MGYKGFLFITLIIPFFAYLSAYFLYMGIKLLNISKMEYKNLSRLQTSNGFYNGYIENYNSGNKNGDYRVRYGLEVDAEGKLILEQSKISTNALKAAYPS